MLRDMKNFSFCQVAGPALSFLISNFYILAVMQNSKKVTQQELEEKKKNNWMAMQNLQ